MTIRIGTSGWNYPTGKGTWNGVFYPPKGRRPKGFDELAYYAEHFDTVEVNTTFYRPPTAAMVQKWAERTPAGFEFSMKLYQKFTHPKMFLEATGSNAAAAQNDVDEFRAGIEPLASAGKLGALLAQFPASFKQTPETRGYLEWLLNAFREHAVSVELRHRSWSDDVAATLTLLNQLGAAWTQIDEPKFRFSIAQNYLPNVTTFYYMRLHGRNGAKWWRHDHPDERYDYLYSSAELKPISETVDAVRRLVKKAYLYTNNHFSAKAVVNAAVIKDQLGLPSTGIYPPEFVERYPEAKDIVRTEAEPSPSLLPIGRDGS